MREHEYCDLIDTIIVVLDDKGKVTLANRKACQILGYSKEEIKGKDWFSTFVPGDKDALRKAFLSYMKGGVSDLEYHDNPIIAKSGKQMNIRWFNTLLKEEAKIIGSFSSGQDVTDLKKAEESLHKSDRFLKEIFTSMVDVITIIDRKGIVLFESPSVMRELGYRPDELVGKPVTLNVHPDDLKKAADVLMGLTIGKDRQVTVRYKDKAGRYLTLQARGRMKEDGEIIITSRNITDKVKNDVKLEETEILFHEILTHTGQLIYDLDLDSGKIRWSGAVEQLMGSADFSADVKGWERLIHPDDRERVMKALNECLKTAMDLDIEYWFRRSDGSYFYVHDKGSFMTTGNGSKRMIGTMSDVTEMRNANVALQEREKRYRMMVEHLNDALYIIDFKGNFLDVNENACRMLGYTKEEFISGGLRLIDDEKNQKNVKERMRELISSGRLEFEGCHVRKDKTKVNVSVSARLISKEGNGLFQSIARDITESKNAAEQKEKLTEELKAKLEELESFHNITIDRELKMIELKKRIEQLERKLKDSKIDF